MYRVPPCSGLRLTRGSVCEALGAGAQHSREYINNTAQKTHSHTHAVNKEEAECWYLQCLNPSVWTPSLIKWGVTIKISMSTTDTPTIQSWAQRKQVLWYERLQWFETHYTITRSERLLQAWLRWCFLQRACLKLHHKTHTTPDRFLYSV